MARNLLCVCLSTVTALTFILPPLWNNMLFKFVLKVTIFTTRTYRNTLPLEDFFFFFLLFFFYWLYNPGRVSVCSTILFYSCLSSTFALQPTIFILFMSSSTWSIHLNPLTPNDPYSGRTAPLTSKSFILYIYSTNIGTEYFKHGIYSPWFPLQNMQFVS